MANDPDEPGEIPDGDLDQWYRVHNGRDLDGESASIGIQARDRLIRRLVEEVRRLRALEARRP
jgi:hypothetical protein